MLLLFQIPVEPKIIEDTIDTEFGKLPRYLLTAQTVDHGRNLMYSVEIIDLKNSNTEIQTLKTDFINRKKKHDKMKFEFLKELPLDNDPYNFELLFADQHGMSLNFVRLIKTDSKFYILETYQLKGSFKTGTKPNKLTKDYFQSFELKN